jgi:uncharacterized protein YjiK
MSKANNRRINFKAEIDSETSRFRLLVLTLAKVVIAFATCLLGTLARVAEQLRFRNQAAFISFNRHKATARIQHRTRIGKSATGTTTNEGNIEFVLASIRCRVVCHWLSSSGGGIISKC